MDELITTLTRLHLSLMYRPQVSLVIKIANIETLNIMLDLSFRRRMYRPMSLLIGLIQIIVLMHHKMFALSYRRRKRRKIMSLNRPTQPLHRFAITTTLMVKRRACAVNPVHTMFHQVSTKSLISRYHTLNYYISQIKDTNADI